MKEKIMKEWLVALAIVLLSISSATAQLYTYNECSPDNTTLVHFRQVRIQVTERNITRTFNVTEPERCWFGCDPERRECNLPQWIYIIVIMAVIAGSYLVFKFVILPMVRK